MHFTPVKKWVEITSLYLEGKTEIWYEEFLLRGNDLAIWEEFARAICMRLGSGKDEEFNKLVQDKGVKEYAERFEELKSLMNALNPPLLQSYYISNFISGIKDDIKPMLKIKPTILMWVFDQVEWQEESNNALAKKNRFIPRTAPSYNMGEESKIEEYGLSSNALVESYAHNTKRIKGSCQGRDIVISIDSGSTPSLKHMLLKKMHPLRILLCLL